MAVRLRKHETVLIEIKLFINMVETKIRYSSSELYDIFYSMISSDRFENLKFIGCCVEGLNRGVPFENAWNSALAETQKKMLLDDEEMSMMKNFGQELGTTDVEGQIGICKMYNELFEVRLEKAREKRYQCSKLYVGLGTMAGVGAAILMI